MIGTTHMTAPLRTAHAAAPGRVMSPCRALCLAAVAVIALGSIPTGGSATEASANSATIAAARAQLLQRLREVRPDLGRIELTVTRLPDSRSIATGPTVVIPANAVQSSVLSARMCVWVTQGRGGHSAGSVPIWFSVKAFRSVLVTQQSHNARDAIAADDLTVEERDVARFSDIPLAINTDLARMRMHRAVMTGHVLLKGDVEPTPQVLRGEEVAVEVQHGAVAIETRAVALREARLGEPVMLQNPTSHETYMARVIGTARAEVVDR